VTANPESILDSVKKVLGFESEYEAFDLDITMHINAAFGSLHQLGVGGDTGFVISDNTTLWSQYVSQLTFLGMVKAYIFMSVRIVFDPPENRFAIGAFQEQLKQLEWRINVAVESITPPSDPFDESVAMTPHFIPKIVNLDFASTISPDAADGNVFYLTLTDDCTINAPVNGVDGQHITLELTSNGFAVTWGNGWNFGVAGAPTLSPSASDIISSVFRESATSWYAGYASGF
jgi:hypothetical protein